MHGKMLNLILRNIICWSKRE